MQQDLLYRTAIADLLITPQTPPFGQQWTLLGMNSIDKLHKFRVEVVPNVPPKELVIGKL